ncbi:MAG TPA: iron-containing redox enzyme family protein [Thermoanaerobaculia bacterium]|nr:iron-containing redox enzyme family protein [Thermoanaerobaculia bacterium]
MSVVHIDELTYPSVLPSSSPDENLHLRLQKLNESRFRPSFPDDQWQEAILAEVENRFAEGEFVESERREIQDRVASVPTTPDAFVAWFEELKETGPGQNDPLFPWLATKATLEQFRWFLRQEVAGEAGFDDLVALTQLKLPVQAKLELARNYWDEMGRGREIAMHGPLLDRLAEELRLGSHPAPIVWEATALGNLLVALAANRRYAFHSVGALGVVELTAPGRAAMVAAGLRRLGIAGPSRRYYSLHATLDIKHSEAWNREVLRPLVEANPETARPIAEGALMRLAAGARCFERYRRELGC